LSRVICHFLEESANSAVEGSCGFWIPECGIEGMGVALHEAQLAPSPLEEDGRGEAKSCRCPRHWILCITCQCCHPKMQTKALRLSYEHCLRRTAGNPNGRPPDRKSPGFCFGRDSDIAPDRVFRKPTHNLLPLAHTTANRESSDFRNASPSLSFAFVSPIEKSSMLNQPL
jgi:hypothetical protein